MKGYCVKCKQKRMMKSVKKMKINGRNLVKGTCGVCSTKMSVFTK